MTKFFVSFQGEDHELELLDSRRALIGGKEYRYEFTRLGERSYVLILNNIVYSVFDYSQLGNYLNDSKQNSPREISVNSRLYEVSVDDERTKLLKSLMPPAKTTAGDIHIRAPMPGLVVRLEVAEGDLVEQGRGLIVLEAMKMENEIKSPHSGVVKHVRVEAGRAVEKGEELLLLHSN